MWPPAIWITSYKHTRLQTTKSISSYPPAMRSWKAKMPQTSSPAITIAAAHNYWRDSLHWYVRKPSAPTYGGRWGYGVDKRIVIPWKALMPSDYPQPSGVEDARSRWWSPRELSPSYFAFVMA